MSDLLEIGGEALFQRFRVEDSDLPSISFAQHAVFKSDHEPYLAAVRAVLAAIEKAGHRIVPVEPDAAWLQSIYERLDMFTRGDINEVLSAALAAAPRATP